MALYYEMEDALLWNWKAPIINDFYVMIYYGVLKKLSGTWCHDESGSLQNDLICGEGGIESAEPAKMLLAMAHVAQEDPALRAAILDAPLKELPDRIRSTEAYAPFERMMQQYLDLYGFRCMNELKLEEYSLRDRPHVVYQVIRNYLKLDDDAALDVKAMNAREQQIRRDAERRAFAALKESWSWLPRRRIFKFVLKRARLGVKNRENMRFARTRIYGLLREVLRALGRQLAGEGVLEDCEDIFYLTLDEVWDYVKGTAVTTDLKGLVKVRRREFDDYRDEQGAVPDERFDTYGMAYHRNTFQRPRGVEADFEGKLRGTGCCPGVISGAGQSLAFTDRRHEPGRRDTRGRADRPGLGSAVPGGVRDTHRAGQHPIAFGRRRAGDGHSHDCGNHGSVEARAGRRRRHDGRHGRDGRGESLRSAVTCYRFPRLRAIGRCGTIS